MQQQADQSTSFAGHLAQTTRETVQLSDPTGAVFSAELYTVVNVEDDPDLHEALLEGELNEVDTPDGGASWKPAVPVRVHVPSEGRYALVIPEALAHRELELRRDFLEELSQHEGVVPRYVRRFDAVVGPGGLEALWAGADAADAAADESAADEAEADASEASEVDGPAAGAELEEEWQALEEEWEALDEEREELDVRREQLESVEERIDRERRQMDDVEQQLAAEREELEAMRRELEEERQELEARKLQIEERERRTDNTPSDEVTQVVTDDQFVSVAEQAQQAQQAEHADEEGGYEELSGGSGVESVGGKVETRVLDEESARSRPGEVQITPIESGHVAETYDAEAADGADSFVDVVDGTVVASCRVDEQTANRLTEEPPAFFVQHHEVEDYPLATLLVAQLDEDAQPVASFGWPLDVSREAHRMVLNRLSEETYLEVAIYDRDGALVGAYAIDGPLEGNVEWIRNRVEERLSDPDHEVGDFRAAADAYRGEEFERIGQMRHNFDRDAFRELDTPAQVKLAAGVVGYWSSDDLFEYLVSNRSYPLERFETLQREVVDAALEDGIFLDAPLRELAIQTGRVADEVELIERLLANFAEVSVRLKANDLEPMDEWDNWDALIEFAQDVGVTPDPEVLELAEASLKRAQDYQEAQQAGADQPPESMEAGVAPEPADEAVGDEAASEDTNRGAADGSEEGSEGADADQTAEDFLDDPAEVDVDTLVVSKRSEATGVTYYLPDSAVIDTFDDFADMPREDLEKLLKDPNGRLEAAQMLVERFDSSVIPAVMEASESMSAPEVTALARFLETKAEGLEAELVRTVESGDASATFIAARALSHIKSTSAIPTLVEAYRDDSRQLNRRAVARTLANYGEKLVPPLSRSIQKNGSDEHVVLLLQYLEETEPGILERLVDNRSAEVREAAEQAREGIQ